MLAEQRAAKIQRRKAQTPANDSHRGNSRCVPADATTYLLRDLDRAFWWEVKAKAALSKTSIKALIEKLLREWLAAPMGEV